MKEIDKVHDEWRSKGEMTTHMAEAVNEKIDQVMEEGIAENKNSIDRGAVDFAFTRMMQLLTFTNAATAKLPLTIGKLGKWGSKLESVVEKLAKSMSANGFSISVGWPKGIIAFGDHERTAKQSIA